LYAPFGFSEPSEQKDIDILQKSGLISGGFLY
jgi:hypothetical protein